MHRNTNEKVLDGVFFASMLASKLKKINQKIQY